MRRVGKPRSWVRSGFLFLAPFLRREDLQTSIAFIHRVKGIRQIGAILHAKAVSATVVKRRFCDA